MDQNNVPSNPVGSYNNLIAGTDPQLTRGVYSEGGDMPDIEARLRAQEKAVAVLEATLANIDKTLADIQSQIKAFLEQTRATATLEHDMKSITDDVNILFGKLKSHSDWIDDHKSAYSKLIAEHEICYVRREDKTKAGWWKDRLGRLVDTAIIGLIVFLLFLFRTH